MHEFLCISHLFHCIYFLVKHISNISFYMLDVIIGRHTWNCKICTHIHTKMHTHTHASKKKLKGRPKKAKEKKNWGVRKERKKRNEKGKNDCLHIRKEHMLAQSTLLQPYISDTGALTYANTLQKPTNQKTLQKHIQIQHAYNTYIPYIYTTLHTYNAPTNMHYNYNLHYSTTTTIQHVL